MSLVDSDLCAFALTRATFWRDQARKQERPSARAICMGNMRKMALVWKRQRPKPQPVT